MKRGDALDQMAEPAPGPDAGFDDLYGRTYPQLVRMAGLLSGDFQVGEEIAQEAFARLVEAAASVAEPVPYLRATVANLCRSRIRRLVTARRVGPLIRGEGAGRPNEDLVAERLAVMAALQKLSRRQREAAVLRLYGGLSEAETAVVMGVSVGAVKTHLHRAVQALSLLLEEVES